MRESESPGAGSEDSYPPYGFDDQQDYEGTYPEEHEMAKDERVVVLNH
jgi:hypothetical protein